MTQMITTTQELVAALGGWAKVAKWAGYEDARGVHNWVTRGIPPSYHLRLVLWAAREGLTVDFEAVFDLAPPDRQALERVWPSIQREIHASP